MSKGTPSMGKKNKISHIRCRRCGRHSYNLKSRVCAACGYGKSAKVKKFNWQTHTLHRDRIK